MDHQLQQIASYDLDVRVYPPQWVKIAAYPSPMPTPTFTPTPCTGSGCPDSQSQFPQCGYTLTPFPTSIFPPHTATPTAFQTLTLADFGIVTEDEELQRWSSVELNNIWIAANRVSDAFSRFGVIGDTGAQRFKTVMGGSVGFLRLAYPRPSNTQYGIYHDEFDNKPLPSGYCQVFSSSAVIPTIVVACRGQITSSTVWNTGGLVTEYSVVHELGHVLDLRSNLTLRNYVGSIELFLADCQTPNTRVMGVGFGTGWNRGQRGWGTASQNPSPPPVQRLSQFQQNPEDSPVEAAADMFLNWVYRSTNGNGFRNQSWSPLEYDPATGMRCDSIDNGCPDTRMPGDARYNWISARLQLIFAAHGW